MNDDTNYSSFIIIAMLLIVIGIHFYTSSKFKCPDCPTCPPVKECLQCPVPSSQGIINYILYTFVSEIETLVPSNYNDFFTKYLIINDNNISDKNKELIVSKIKNQVKNKYIFNIDNVVYLNMTTDDKEKFKKKYNTYIIPNPLFIIKDIDLVFGFSNDPAQIKVFIDITAF
jgi:hypothetical protein